MQFPAKEGAFERQFRENSSPPRLSRGISWDVLTIYPITIKSRGNCARNIELTQIWERENYNNWLLLVKGRAPSLVRMVCFSFAERFLWASITISSSWMSEQKHTSNINRETFDAITQTRGTWRRKEKLDVAQSLCAVGNYDKLVELTFYGLLCVALLLKSITQLSI